MKPLEMIAILYGNHMSKKKIQCVSVLYVHVPYDMYFLYSEGLLFSTLRLRDLEGPSCRVKG